MDVEWIAWGLAGSPSGYRWYVEEDPHPNKDRWTL